MASANDMDVARQKQTMRAAMRQARAGLPAAVRPVAGRSLSAAALPVVQARGGRLAVYLSVGDEVPTGPLIENATAHSLALCAPVSDGAGGYVFAAFETGCALADGPMHIPEPVDAPRVDPADISVVIVPGLAFDREGRRLGQGGGHYDRLLQTLDVIAIGAAFEACVVDRVPDAAHDRRVDVVVTEAQVIRVDSAATNRE